MVAALHALAVALLLQFEGTREALRQVSAKAPIMIEFITPKADAPPKLIEPAKPVEPIKPKLAPQPKLKPIAKAAPVPPVAPMTPAPVSSTEARESPPVAAEPPRPLPPAPEAPIEVKEAQTAPSAPAIAAAAPVPAPPAPVTPPSFNADYLHNPKPDYPVLARRMGEQGKVLLRVYVTASGRAERVELRASSGSARLDQAALDTVRGWRFVPAKQGSEPTPAWVIVPIVFSMES